MLKPSSSVAALTLAAFVQSQSGALRANPILLPEPVQKPLTPSVAYPPYTLYLGTDPYSQAMLKLQYNQEEKVLEWQLLNNGYGLSSQSHPMPENILTVDNGLVYNGDLIIVTGITTGQRWFIYALNSQGEFQWQRQGRGHIEDLAFSDNGDSIYAVGSSRDHPLLLAVNAQSGEVEFHSGADKVIDDDDAGISYRQIVVTGDKELVIARHRETDGQLQLTQWRAVVDADTGEDEWGEDSGFCKSCSQTGVKAVALQYDREQRRLYSVTSDGRQLVLATRNPLDGQSLSSVQTFPIKAGKGVWDTVFRVEEPGFGQNTGIVGSDPIIGLAETSSRLGLISSGCRLWLGGAVFDGNTLLAINACKDSAALLPGRRLLQAENGTESYPTDSIDHRENFELFATIIGVLGGATLITGVFFYMKGLWKKYKTNLFEAEKEEHSRRGKEKIFLDGLINSNPKFLMDLEWSAGFVEGYKTVLSKKPEPDDRRGMTTDKLFKSLLPSILSGYESFEESELEKIADEKDQDDNTILHYLAKINAPNLTHKHLKVASSLLKSGASLNSRSVEGYSPIELAVVSGNWQLLDMFLTWSSEMSFDEISALFHLSIQSKNREVLTVLLNRRMHEGIRFTPKKRQWIKIDKRSVQTESGLTLLHQAIQLDCRGCIQVLIESRLVDITEKDSSGNTVLHFAAVAGNNILLSDFLRLRINIDAKNSNGNTALHLAAQRPENTDTILRLLNAGASPSIKNNSRRTPFDLACERGLKNNAEKIADKYRERIILHQTTLHYLVRNEHLDVIKFIFPLAIFNIDELDEMGQTPIISALKSGHIEVATVLLNYWKEVHEDRLRRLNRSSSHLKPNLRLTDRQGNTALHIAATESGLRTLSDLHKNGARLDVQNQDGDTALHLAAKIEDVENAEALIKLGANHKLKNNDGLMMMEYFSDDSDKQTLKDAIDEVDSSQTTQL